MKIGILSDTHNNTKMIQKAVSVFKSRKVDYVIHAGDITSSRMIDFFKGLNCKFVLGNCDCDIEIINEKSRSLGFGNTEKSFEFTIDNEIFLVFHGNNVPLFRKAVASGKYDYIIKGHTHFYEDYVSNGTVIINPGSLNKDKGGFIIILYTEKRKIEKIYLSLDSS